mmetsp:Transcript_36869/g.71934  ORF Transcript_36869/g.71934 Transcript_36869/m.71934 type:complete len:254 (+) Transcript_36869:153-914(+)
MVPRWVWLGAATAAVCAAGEVQGLGGPAPALHKAPGMLLAVPTQRPGAAFAPPPVLHGGHTRRTQQIGGLVCTKMQLRQNDPFAPKDPMNTEGFLDLPNAPIFLPIEDIGPPENNTPSQLVTYGDVFRAALSEEEEREKREEETRRVKPVAVAVSAASKVGTKVGNGVRAVLERLLADTPEEEISRNMEAFAQRYGGTVGLPVMQSAVQTKVDMDRLEAVLELELDGEAREVVGEVVAEDEDGLSGGIRDDCL